MEKVILHYKVLIAGGGPAGTGPLFYAIRNNRLKQLLDAGVAIVDKGEHLACGTIGQHVINSDTLGGVFLECLQGNEEGLFSDVMKAEITAQLRQYSSSSVPLQLVGQYMKVLGVALENIVNSNPASRFFYSTEIRSVHTGCEDGKIHVMAVRRCEGEEREIEFIVDKLVMAMGGKQSYDQVSNETIAGTLPLAPYRDKMLLTSHALTPAGSEEMQRRLKEAGNKKVVIIGGSHSAFSSAWTLLNKVAGIDFSEGDITLMHRSKLKLFYPTRENAIQEGYTDFTDEDICPLTKRVYRLAGLRLDSRELLKRVWGMSSWGVENRVKIVSIDPQGNNADEIKKLLDEAALIIPAFGYRPNVVPVFDASGQEVDLLCRNGGALVDDKGCVLDAHRQPVANIYGIGLASGFVPSGDLGGEASFMGQTNGLWLYQNGVGELVFNQLETPVPVLKIEINEENLAAEIKNGVAPQIEPGSSERLVA